MRVTLDEVCTKATSKYAQKDLANMTGEYPVFGASGFIKNIGVYQQEKTYVAVVKDGAGIGRTMLLPGKSSVIGTMQYLLPKENVLPKFLYYAVKSMHLEKYYTGATIPHIYFKDYKKETFDLPEDTRQKEIINIFDKVELIIQSRKLQLKALDELVKSRFVEMFGGIHNSSLYPYVTIECFTTVISGGTPNRGISEYWQDGRIRWVKSTELHNCVITDTEEKITQLGMSNSSAKLIPADSVLIAMYGQGKTRGMTGYLAVTCTTNQACACILPSPTVNQKYLWQYMILSYDKLRNMAKGGNQPNLNVGIIKKFPVLMPPLELQVQFAAFVSQIDKSRLAIQKSLDEAQLLFDSLMQKYFG